MIILAIDTSTDACSAALFISTDGTKSNNSKTIERFELAPRAHTHLILPMIDELLKEAGLKLQDVDAFAFGQGPGSFTGVRIAASIIQGLSFGVAKPVIPISTLRAIAQGAYRESGITQCFAWLDARLEQIYWGLFKLDSHNIMQAVTKEGVESENLIELPEGFRAEDWPKISNYPRAADIAHIAAALYQSGHLLKPEDAQPVYLRDEVVKKKKE